MRQAKRIDAYRRRQNKMRRRTMVFQTCRAAGKGEEQAFTGRASEK
jgi:hypothetical protein